MVKVDDKRSFNKEGELKEPVKEKQEKKEQKTNKLELLPPPNFSDFILSLYASAMLSMGAIEIEGTEKGEIDLSGAKQTIDLLEMLLKKTEGNLTEEEKNLFDTIITELRLNFVDLMGKL